MPLRAAAVAALAGGILSCAVSPALAAVAARPLAARPAAAPPAAAPPPPAVAAVLGRARQALSGVTRVHLEGRLSEVVDGVGVYVAVAVDAGARYGRLSETIASGGRKLSFAALVTPSAGFCTGDADALVAGCTLTARQAFAATGHWVSFAPSSTPYRVAAGSALYGRQLAGLLPATGAGFVLLTGRSAAAAAVSGGVAPATPAGRASSAASLVLRGPADAVAGFPAGTVETLELAQSDHLLPVAVSFRQPGRVSASERFSAWGRRFDVRVPRHPLRLASLR